MKSSKIFWVIGILAILAITGMAAIEQPVNDNFKNLQVLPKNITADSLDRIMDGFNIQLGVDCNYCHAKDKITGNTVYEKDDKAEKEITRNMMRMTMDINKKYFQFNEQVSASEVQAVTCYTCHRANPIPEKEKKVATTSPFNFKSN